MPGSGSIGWSTPEQGSVRGEVVVVEKLAHDLAASDRGLDAVAVVLLGHAEVRWPSWSATVSIGMPAWAIRLAAVWVGGFAGGGGGHQLVGVRPQFAELGGADLLAVTVALEGGEDGPGVR